MECAWSRAFIEEKAEKVSGLKSAACGKIFNYQSFIHKDIGQLRR